MWGESQPTWGQIEARWDLMSFESDYSPFDFWLFWLIYGYCQSRFEEYVWIYCNFLLKTFISDKVTVSFWMGLPDCRFLVKYFIELTIKASTTGVTLRIPGRFGLIIIIHEKHSPWIRLIIFSLGQYDNVLIRKTEFQSSLRICIHFSYFCSSWPQTNFIFCYHFQNHSFHL